LAHVSKVVLDAADEARAAVTLGNKVVRGRMRIAALSVFCDPRAEWRRFVTRKCLDNTNGEPNPYSCIDKNRCPLRFSCSTRRAADEESASRSITE
jgi:hypothetical protein